MREIRKLWKLQQRFKSKRHDISTIKVYKIQVSSNNDKRKKTLDCRKTFTKEVLDKNAKINKWKILKTYA